MVVVPVCKLTADVEREGTQSAAYTVNVSVWHDENGLTYVTTDYKTATITAYTGRNASLIVPQNVGACQVNAIADAVFENCSTLKRIELPLSITKVGKRVFANCDLLSIMN